MTKTCPDCHAEVLSTSQPNRMGTTPAQEELYMRFNGEEPRTEALRVISTLAICEDGETAEQRALIVDACREVAANALAATPALDIPLHKAIERIIDDHSAWIARPNDEVTRAIAKLAIIAVHEIISERAAIAATPAVERATSASPCLNCGSPSDELFCGTCREMGCTIAATPAVGGEAPEWLWFGEDENGGPIVTFGRWPKNGAKWRYKLAEIQPTEHDHPELPKRPFAFAVLRAPENGHDQWRLFMDEGEAREAAEQLDGGYEGLYRVGDRRSALYAAQPAAPAVGGKNAREIAHNHCTCTCKDNPKVGQNHTNLCDEITKAILEFAALTDAHAVGEEALVDACMRLQSFLDTFGDVGGCETQADLNDWLAIAQPASPLRGITEDKLTQMMDEAWPDGHRVMARKIIAELGASPLRGREAVQSVLDQYWFWDELDERHREMLLDELSAAPPGQPAAAQVTGALNFVEQAAILIWCELCPGMMMGDEDLPHYEAAIRQAMRDLQSPADEETQA